jgi:glycosyltransferase involved in cell wall biosynthesis
MNELPGTRVAIVTPTMKTRGGTEIYIRRLMRVQRGLGLSISIFTQDAAGEVAHIDDVPVTGCGSVLSEAMSPRKLLGRAREVRALADRIATAADWVEFHRIAPIDLLRALRGRVPTMLFLHTPELTCPALGRYLQNSGSCCERPPGAGCLRVHAIEGCLSRPDGTVFPAQQRLRALIRGPLTRALAAASTAFIFNSEANRDLHLRTTVAPRRCFVLHPPLDAVSSSAQRVPNRLLFSGRLEVHKGILDAVRVAAALPATELHVCGAGPAEGRARDLATKLGATVNFRGWQDAAELAHETAEASCMLLPSRSFEAWGMVGPEAIMAGCAVVAFDTGGVREWLDPRFGEIVPVGDVNGMALAAGRQLKRMAAGVDTSTWRDAVLDRWGETAFTHDYARVIKAACHDDDHFTGRHRQVVRPASGPRRLTAGIAAAHQNTRVAIARVAQHMLFAPPHADAARVMVYRIGTIGDHTCAAPALAAIRKRHPDAQIILITEKRGGEPWPVQLGFVSAFRLNVREYDSIAELRRLVKESNPQTLYYLAPQPLSLRRALRDALFFRAAGVLSAIGFGAVDFTVRGARAVQPWRESHPETLRLLHACGLPTPDMPRMGQSDAGLPPDAIVFAPAGKTATQRWPESRFIALARLAESHGFTPVWLGDSADAERLRAAGDAPGITMMGTLSPSQLHGVARSARAVVSNDTGIAHIAALNGTPLLVVSSARTLRNAWTPWGPGPVRVLRRSMNCEGCYLAECEDIACLRLIHVDEAWQALARLLANRATKA